MRITSSLICFYLLPLERTFVMTTLYNESAPKKATNLSINSDLLRQARELGLNLSATLEQALIQHLKAVQTEQWKSDNKHAIAALNHLMDKQGLYKGDGAKGEGAGH